MSLPAERLRLGKVDVAHGKVITLGQFRRRLARQQSDDSLPLPLRRLVLSGPEPSAERDLDLILAGTPLGFARGTAHHEFARRAPAEFDPGDLSFVASLNAIEGGGDNRLGRSVHHCHRIGTPAIETDGGE